eukprot:scaffold37574_cov31-Prasinocladus_malaysianus.AAC.2
MHFMKDSYLNIVHLESKGPGMKERQGTDIVLVHSKRCIVANQSLDLGQYQAIGDGLPQDGAGLPPLQPASGYQRLLKLS